MTPQEQIDQLNAEKLAWIDNPQAQKDALVAKVTAVRNTVGHKCDNPYAEPDETCPFQPNGCMYRNLNDRVNAIIATDLAVLAGEQIAEIDEKLEVLNASTV